MAPTTSPLPPLTGLTPAEAEARLHAFGPNRLATVERRDRLKATLEIIPDPMALILAAAVVYLLLRETRDGIILLAVLISVLGVDVFLEARSREALKKDWSLRQ